MTVYDNIRLKVNDPNGDIYTDAVLSGYMTDYNNDANAVAGEIWSEKAAILQATALDYSTEGESYKLNQTIENAWYLAKYYNSKRKPTTSLWIKSPDEDTTSDDLQVG